VSDRLQPRILMASSIIGSDFHKRRSNAWELQSIACRQPLKCVPTSRRCSLRRVMECALLCLPGASTARRSAIHHSKTSCRVTLAAFILHMWRPDLRRKGHGPHLFCLAAVDFYERFRLKRIICEPKADNQPPNRLLQRIGFPLISTRVGRSSELSKVCNLNRYDIVREIAEDYLLTHQQAGEFKQP